MAKLSNSLIGLPKNLRDYVRESYQELRKVSWPTRETTIRYTVIVVVASVVVGLLIGGVDFIFTSAVERAL